MSASPNDEYRQPRREFLTRQILSHCSAAAVLAAGSTASSVAVAQTAAVGQATTSPQRPRFRYCLNTSTINGGEVPIRQQLKIAAEAGYDSVEPWLRDIEKFVAGGGQLSDLAKEISDLGLGIDSAIAFGNWIVDDAEKRLAGLEQCKRDMEVVRTLGGTRIAAPPAGATKEPKLNLDAAGERYRALLEVGTACGVLPQLELWGFSYNLATLPEVLYVLAAANHPQACVLLDVYHLFKGGSDFTNLDLVPAHKMYCLHMNDYPSSPPRAEIADKDRVYPGDGVAPIRHILDTLVAGGFAGTLSLELFNRDYWGQPPAEVAKMGLQKMKAAAEG